MDWCFILSSSLIGGMTNIRNGAINVKFFDKLLGAGRKKTLVPGACICSEKVLSLGCFKNKSHEKKITSSFGYFGITGMGDRSAGQRDYLC
jgi:hypothetical protein